MPLTLAQLEALSQQTFPTKAVARRDPDGYAALHATIAEALHPVARALEFDMSSFVARAQDELLALPPHILLVWCDEADLMASLYALPESDIAANVAQALHAVAGLRFGDPAQLPSEQRGAVLRIMAAIGTPLARDVDDFFAAYIDGGAQDPELPVRAEVEALFDQFAPCYVADADGLDRRFTRVITVHHHIDA
ncbi:hypothetical protein [Nannocystis punicea]|uniref:Uncharacterized protein n=1 Tax=Nannocystis punicea TaxID=2995304 RepID=A0ABY7GZB7_9BACT|nr:hypothetical protein [Nannocystis poenicansa]WAS92268.1 hypothetical protein O0S08_39315 [Nannocystis poenicansa]